MAISARKSNLAYMDRVILSTLETWCICDARHYQFAFHEAIINAIQARENCMDLMDDNVYLSLELEGDILRGEVKDSFGGNNQKATKEGHDQWCENGRGLMLMSNFVDQLDVFNNQQGGFTVKLIKRNAVERS